MPKSHRFIRSSMFITLVLFIATLCFSISHNADAAEKELVIIAWEIPYGLDPVHEFTPGYLHGVGAIEYLLKLTPESKVEPELAESFRSVNDTTWEVILRPGIKFWSGKTVDAAAVKASLERSRKLCPQAEPLLKGVSINVIDEKTLHFVTEKPHPSLPLNLANQWLGIHNAESYGQKPNPFDLSVMDLTGFFKVTEFKPKQFMKLERWDGYWGKRPKLDHIVYKQIADDQARMLAALSGEAHIIRNLSAEGTLALKANNDMELVVIEKPSVASVYLNLQAPVFQDVRVRQALAWAINRQEMITLARGGFGSPAFSWFATNPAYPEAVKAGYTVYDPKRAGQMLDAAGWKIGSNGIRQKDGKPFNIRLLSYGGNKPASELLQNYWQQLGIQVEVQHSPDYGIAQSKRSEGAWEAVIESWGTFPTHQSLWRHFAPDGDINYGPVNDTVINNILKQLAVTINQDAHDNLVYQANQWIVDTVPIIPLYSTVALKAKSKKVKNFFPHPAFYQYEVTPDTDLTE